MTRGGERRYGRIVGLYLSHHALFRPPEPFALVELATGEIVRSATEELSLEPTDWSADDVRTVTRCDASHPLLG